MQGPGTREEQQARQGQQQAQRLIEDVVRVLVRLLEVTLLAAGSYLLYRILHSAVLPSNQYHQVARHGTSVCALIATTLLSCLPAWVRVSKLNEGPHVRGCSGQRT